MLLVSGALFFLSFYRSFFSVIVSSEEVKKISY